MSRTRHLDREVGRALSAVSAAAKRGLGDPALAELVVIRASQLNHCAFCLDMHLAVAREHGVSERQLDLLAAWEEAEDVFDERERAALALTEAVTVLTGGTSRTKSGGGFVPDAVYERAAAHFDDGRLAHLVGLIVAINNWNRMMVSRRTPPGGCTP
ncbi:MULTISPECIES: carboxymuconolactone decarboxylase family protein [unclassified Streptomyces]|uniref:carboxymuconolactone decarboxylase family protein n=1 Tax=unclassified Streptomyces TaxID=2593676 RepID=UPI002254CB1F|nr:MULTISPECIES: carboxymuconolactone decarboxylase family protein [unclassified Streptomyces]MCX4883113.1 carboxymuconolactone decarboxylase family protein [Streptomyces sp. NBC_00847]MCX5050559.1 carboxymuconolactone decarboxylase family protein [Streptomyces sp. NBC_00474]MCX5248467.1 carboxymuconolactone decarboxylase family protein [Streptomyces sp. NBC_00201]